MPESEAVFDAAIRAPDAEAAPPSLEPDTTRSYDGGTYPGDAGTSAFQRPIGPFALGSSAEAGGEYASFLRAAAAAGCEQVRLFGEWAAIEPRSGQFDFAAQDGRIAAAAALGIETGGVFAFSADWALPPGVSNRKTFPANPASWQRYTGAVAARYASTVRFWEVWNEPNSTAFNAGAATASDYAALVRTAYASVKATNPAAQVGLTVANYDVRFLRQVISALAAQGAAESFDFIALHPYELVVRSAQPNGELQYLAVVSNLRRMLRATAPAKADVPVHFSELGVALGASIDGTVVDPPLVAALLVKSYVLGLAQGVERLAWFEIQDGGGSQDWGLSDDDGSKRPAYFAFATLTKVLGRTPRYRGWRALGAQGLGYGFVFSSDDSVQLAAWMPRGQRTTLTFPTQVQAYDITTGAVSSLAAGAPYMLEARPVLFDGLPESLAREADADADRPFPWGELSETPTRATLELGAAPASHGLVQDQPSSSRPTRFPDGTAGARIDVGGNNKMYFSLSPGFASYDTHEVHVRARVRVEGPASAGQLAYVNLFYQPYDGDPGAPLQYPYVGAGADFRHVPVDDAWHTLDWHLTDAMFVHTFGYALYLQLEGVHPLAVGKVDVSTVPF